jgi:hypothetical protein
VIDALLQLATPALVPTPPFAFRQNFTSRLPPLVICFSRSILIAVIARLDRAMQ